MNLYREKDIQRITDKLDEIVDESIKIRNEILEPSLQECNDVKDVIRTFIKNKKRIVYGGTAYNELIKSRSPEDAIYRDIECKDIEFYSPVPIADAVELSDILHDAGYKYVRCTQANHDETYTIFVNFNQICDISYMAENVFYNMPSREIDGVLYADPKWIIVDVLRQYNNPITAYWRLKDKTFFRANALLKVFPLELEDVKIPEPKSSIIDMKQKLLDELVNMETLIFVGSMAEHYYLNRKSKMNLSNIRCYSTKYDDDIKTIYKMIEKITKKGFKNVSVKAYSPFTQFNDESIEFCHNSEMIIKIYGSSGICIPYNNLYLKPNNNLEIEKIQMGGYYKSKLTGGANNTKMIKIGTFIVLFNNLLIERNYQYVNRSDKYKIVESRMKKLLEEREKYLEKNNMDVLDQSPYKEFVIRCSGETIDPAYKFRVERENKRSKGKRTMFTYNPQSQKGGPLPDFRFNNSSGNKMKNSMSKLF